MNKSALCPPARRGALARHLSAGVFDQQALRLQHLSQIAQFDGGAAFVVPADKVPLGVVALLGQPDNLFHFVPADHHHTVRVAAQDVAGVADLIAENDRVVDGSNCFLDRAFDAHTA
jgi:hypothetical protein